MPSALPVPLSVLLAAGPPASATLWTPVVARLRARSPALQVEVIELFDPPPADPSVGGLARVLAEVLATLPRPVALVAHGSAVPVALRAAGIARPDLLVLSNGPIHRLDPILAGLAFAARAPRLLAATALQPMFLQNWLASSAGLRRAVVNPYVMDRDMVVALLAPLVKTAAHRRALACFLASLPAAVASPPVYRGPTLLCWGDADPLYPASHADEARSWLPNATVATIPGGQHLHPEERPWAFADLLTACWSGEATATQMSRSAPSATETGLG